MEGGELRGPGRAEAMALTGATGARGETETRTEAETGTVEEVMVMGSSPCGDHVTVSCTEIKEEHIKY